MSETQSEALVVAQRYFDLSNARDLDAVESLFTETSTYSSDNTGVYFGKKQIMAMMRPFFEKFTDLKWSVKSAEEIRPGVVLFDFTFSGITTSGESVQRAGREYVIVYDGKLQHVEVRNEV